MSQASNTPRSRDTIGTRKRGTDWAAVFVVAIYFGWLLLAVYLVEFR